MQEENKFARAGKIASRVSGFIDFLRQEFQKRDVPQNKEKAKIERTSRPSREGPSTSAAASKQSHQFIFSVLPPKPIGLVWLSQKIYHKSALKSRILGISPYPVDDFRHFMQCIEQKNRQKMGHITLFFTKRGPLFFLSKDCSSVCQ